MQCYHLSATAAEPGLSGPGLSPSPRLRRSRRRNFASKSSSSRRDNAPQRLDPASARAPLSPRLPPLQPAPCVFTSVRGYLRIDLTLGLRYQIPSPFAGKKCSTLPQQCCTPLMHHFKMPKPFSVSSIPSLSGKVVLITGGNDGLGFEVRHTCRSSPDPLASPIAYSRRACADGQATDYQGRPRYYCGAQQGPGRRSRRGTGSERDRRDRGPRIFPLE